MLGNLLALAGVCPFVGSLSDLLGRRYVCLIGASLLVIGVVVQTTAKDMNMFIAGSTIAGAAAGINELTALAVTSELAPTRKRGAYVAVLIFTIVPFVPSGIYAQLIAGRIFLLLVVQYLTNISSPCWLEILRYHYLHLERIWFDHYCLILLSTTATQFQREGESTGPFRD